MTATVDDAGVVSHVGGAGLDTDTLEMMIGGLGDFVDHHLTPQRQLDLDRDDVCPEDIVRAMSDPEQLGVQLVFVPEEYGGMDGNAFDSYRICEEMARHDIGLATAVFATFLGSDPILVGATEDQRHRWLGAIANDGIVFAYGATEPDAGSDLASMKTTAERILDDDGAVTGYRINGRKQWISNGSIADMTTVLALCPDGPSWFVVPKGADGFEAAHPEDKHGLRLSNTAALFLDDVEVPADHLIGGVEGKGLQQAQQVFGYTRIMVAAFGLGGGWEALDRAIAYSIERQQGGGPLSEKQGFTHKLIVPHAVRLEAARSYIEASADKIDRGLGENGAMNTEGAIAKLMATEAGNDAADSAIQALGGYGYTREYVVEKIKRDVRITTIYEGTSEIMEMTIARDRWQHHLKTKGAYYRDRATAMLSLHERQPMVGADHAALALHTLSILMESCRLARLTRNQHVLFRLGDLITQAECAEAFALRAAETLAGERHPKSPDRFDGDALAAMSRVFARDAAQHVGQTGLRWVAGSVEVGQADVSALLATIPHDALRASQAGLLADMNRVADILYDRTS